jgi:hypothetical protein
MSPVTKSCNWAAFLFVITGFPVLFSTATLASPAAALCLPHQYYIVFHPSAISFSVGDNLSPTDFPLL